MITKKAYAKVNLTLDITGRRDDGYHLVRMLMQSLDIADVLTFEKLEVNSGEERIVTQMKDKRETENAGGKKASQSSKLENEDELGVLPMGPDNLIYKVAEMLLSKYVWNAHPEYGVKITLEKNIPIAAGLAGGSSDGAATFRGINELFELGLHEADLMDMGVKLGADIPYCIMGGTALSEGIGEVLTRLPQIPKCTFLVAKPAISVSTAEAYGGYDKLIESPEGRHIKRPDVDGQVDRVYAGDVKGIAHKMSNVLELVTAKNHPEIETLEKIMKECGAVNSIMSGSGPTVYGIFTDENQAEEAAAKIQNTGIIEQLFITRPV